MTIDHADSPGTTSADLEWTGERCVPWVDDTQLVYEHYHRYALAAEFTTGKRVLDLASGEGYGCALLARTAADVIGVDIDPVSVEHAQRHYGELANVTFRAGSITDRDLLTDEGTFDVITCFEAIEHVAEQEALLAMVGARLAANGLFIVSTPDVAVYQDELDRNNPFHVKELTEQELTELLGRSFEHVAIYRQNVAVGSVITRRDGTPNGAPDAAQTIGHTLRRHDGWEVEQGLPHTYLVAFASRASLGGLPSSAILLDSGMTLTKQSGEVALGLYGESRREVAELKQTITDLETLRGEAAEDARVTLGLYEECRREAGELKQTIADLETLRGEAAEQAQVGQTAAITHAIQAAELEESARASAESAVQVQKRLTASERARMQAEAERDALRAGRVVRTLTAYREAVERWLPTGTRRRDLYRRTVGSPPPPESTRGGGLLALPTSANPEVSVVLPVHGHWEVTLRCLRSIAEHPPLTSFEVIVVDDASPDDTAARLRGVYGIEVLTMPENVGFLQACNSAFATTRGKFTMLLNNDTEVTPGWLDELVFVAREPDIGAVGSRLVYPDGRLQEAGGVIFSDGGGWNVGRGLGADDPAFNYRRSVDYCSGAALMVRSDLLKEIGGFDERFAPAYYEDTDLQFEIRSRGFDVVYQPRSTVVHYEGVSHGTDVTSGIKAFQVINQRKFANKWQSVLADQPPPPAESLQASTRWCRTQGVIVIIDHFVPRADEDSGSKRMLGIVQTLISMGYGVVYVPDNRHRHEPYTSELQQLGVEVLYGDFDLRRSLQEIADVIRLVMLCRPNVAWKYLSLVRETLPDCPVVYDTVDLHFLRERRRAEIAGTTTRGSDATRELELGLMRASDLTLVVSPIEQQLLSSSVPDVRTEILPNVHLPMVANVRPAGRSGLLFVGCMVHDPNEDAVVWFVQEVLPLVHQRRLGITLRIVGRDPSPKVSALVGHCVEVAGWVSDLDPVYNTARVTIAPLRYGAGIKGKIGESLAYGVPVVTTSVGAEGMGLVHRETALIANEAQDFADAILELVSDDTLWSALSQAGRDHVDARYGETATRLALQRLIDVRVPQL